MPKFYRHWGHRLGLESLKIQQAMKYGSNPTENQLKSMNNEISKYITECYSYETKRKLDDVFVTDHQSTDEKYVTADDDEDLDFYEYQKSIDEYNSEEGQKTAFQAKSRYVQGSLLQKIMDPLAGSSVDENGSVMFTVKPTDVASLLGDDEALKAEYERMLTKSEVWEVEEDDEDAFRLNLMQELEEDTAGFKVKDFEAVLDKEFGIFAKGESYNYVKDIKEAYKDSLKTTTEDKIFNTLPEHVFWDIKKPLVKPDLIMKNRYNPFRGREYGSFFEMRDSEKYMDQ